MSTGFQFKDGRFRIGNGKKFFIVRLMRQLNRLPREAADVPSRPGWMEL